MHAKEKIEWAHQLKFKQYECCSKVPSVIIQPQKKEKRRETINKHTLIYKKIKKTLLETCENNLKTSI